ncbi:metal-dependent hydrolase [Erythrobacter sp.]|uniref:metal-dependent hydrolase n=1 Tax=Erythrobacter sp. TaxID=1042 RepID=UPI001B09C95D|nr:metal-dependent hydrolase [Erythrobacter sp.]MBO6526198.1 metal-dependent hydrolase [Erythrobacter sp.]MBO6530451.1 metal-dependent hydrolase [Erythrobacter sp.]
MDNLTHSLVGALIGQAGLKRKTGLAMPALIIGANLPDVDAACLFWLEGVEHLGFRRGITHGPIAWVLLPLVLAALLYGFDRWQAKRGTRPAGRLPVDLKWLYLLSFIACLTHPALDWLNVYGIRLLEPFSSQWYYGDTLFIIDVWLWALLGFATWFSLRREKRGGEWQRPARAAMAVALVYIGVNGVISASHGWHSANPLPGATTAISSPLPVASVWREEITGSKNDWYYLHDSADVWVPFLEREKRCAWPSASELHNVGSQAEAFLFWSRAPFAERAPDGSVVLRDARFYDPRARDRFSVALPNVECEELSAQ